VGVHVHPVHPLATPMGGNGVSWRPDSESLWKYITLFCTFVLYHFLNFFTPLPLMGGNMLSGLSSSVL